MRFHSVFVCVCTTIYTSDDGTAAQECVNLRKLCIELHVHQHRPTINHLPRLQGRTQCEPYRHRSGGGIVRKGVGGDLGGAVRSKLGGFAGGSTTLWLPRVS
jgi:hypothetical protein